MPKTVTHYYCIHCGEDQGNSHSVCKEHENQCEKYSPPPEGQRPDVYPGDRLFLLKKGDNARVVLFGKVAFVGATKVRIIRSNQRFQSQEIPFKEFGVTMFTESEARPALRRYIKQRDEQKENIKPTDLFEHHLDK